MAKDPLAANVSKPEGGYYEGSEELRHQSAESKEEIVEGLTRSEVINVFGEKLGNLLIDGGYASISSIMMASDSDLEDVKGVGKATVKQIREQLAEEASGAAGVEAEPARQPIGADQPTNEEVSVRVQRIRDSHKQS